MVAAKGTWESGLQAIRTVERLATAGLRSRARRNADAALEAMAASATEEPHLPAALPAAGPDASRHPGRSSHRLLTYDTPAQFLDVAVPFLLEGHAAGEPLLVITAAQTAEAMRAHLPEDVEADFVEAHTWYQTPAQTMAAFGEYLAQHSDRPGVRLLGEPVLSGRSADELAEWACYEAALNVAFPRGGIHALCAYSTAELAGSVTAEARRTHPHLADAGRCADFVNPYGYVPHPEPTLAPPPTQVATARLDARNLDATQRFVTRQAFEAGVFGHHARTVALAAREAARELLVGAGSGGRLQVWAQGREMVCELSCERPDLPRIAGYLPPLPGAGRGLWLARQLCRLVQVRAERGTVLARLHYTPHPA